MPEGSLLKAKRHIRKRRLSSAEGHLRKALDELQELPADIATRHREECVNVACELARVQARGGHVAEAERLLGFALEIGRDAGAVASCLQVYRLRALLYAHLCRFAEARAECERAHTMVQEAGLDAIWGSELQATIGLIARVEGNSVAAVRFHRSTWIP
jgi:tetratricopeptide (TPR) repeat protein